MSEKKQNRNHGPGGMRLTGAKPKDFKASMGRLLTYLKPYRMKMIAVLVFASVSAGFGIFGPKLLGKATTRIFEGVMQKFVDTSASIDFSYVGGILLTLVGLYGLSALFAYIQGYIMSGVSMDVSYNLRREIEEKMHRMPFKYFDENTHGEVLSRMTNDVDSVSQTLNQSLSQMITSFTTVVGVLVMMISISGWMTLVALAIIPVSMIVVSVIVKQSQKYFKRQQKYLGHVNGHVEEMFGGHRVVKAFNGEEKSIGTFKGLNDDLYKTSWKAQFLSSIMMPVINIVGNLGYVAVCVLGGTLAARQAIEVGDIQAFIQYVRNFTQPISQLANISNILQQTVASAERVFEFLDESEEVKEREDALTFEDVKGAVRFESVSFGYNPEQTVINDFNLDVHPGQRVAIVGPTGAGKTTLVKLLMRFYDVSKGRITIDGTEITAVSRHDLRSQFGMVLQDTWLYNASIMENIRYGRLDATDEEVIEAAKAAHVDGFVHMLPRGYDMEINEEANNLSQGQKQLITIARAILANPKLLILDEATSSVDTRTEVQIQNAMLRLMKDKTSFIIAHRLSTIQDADTILVLNHGDIVEQGTHEELLARKGFYADLYNA
ncbi:ABC transporter ATP-binding protein [Fusibacter sp. JL298sf-3]